MNQELSARGVLFSEGHLATDDSLLAQALTGDDTAISQLWNRYYSIATVEASKRATKSASPDKVVLKGFRRSFASAKKKNTSSVAFLSQWFSFLGAEPPNLTNRAVLWAFYSLPVRNRIIAWRHRIDQWPTRKLARAVDLNDSSAHLVFDQVMHQFAGNVALAMGLLAGPPNREPYLTSEGQTTALSRALLDTTPEIIAELGPRVPVEYVISPPAPAL
ncbi:MAG: hypothetical protein FWG08_01660 [Propionibacteriaceae bacterium]|nr:hypothetical protein [Propionibacteriaceae bacterium]